MTLYCISYDLIDKKDYEKIEKTLKKYKNFHALESVWFIETEEEALIIRKKLKEATDKDDEIFVVEIKKHWASTNVSGIPDWLKSK